MNGDITLYNQEVKGWGDKIRSRLANSIKQLSQKGKGELMKSLTMKTRRYYGAIDRITYNFERHGVFFHKGTGRGYKMTGGNVMRVATGNNKTLTDSSIKRKPAEWFNPIINNNIDDLANIVAIHMADAAVNATRLKIN
jgi:hypothetical protein